MKIYTSESVCAGHPDKICDQISDAILDAALRGDVLSRVAVETMVGKNICIMMGEVTTKAQLKYEQIARSVIKKLGYDKAEYGFWDKSRVEVYIHEQSREIAQGVDEKGAGDQGMMYGFACNETAQLMPIPIMIAHAIACRIDEVRQKSILEYLKPDGKTQVSVEYERGIPKRIASIVIAVPHEEKIKLAQVKEDLYKQVVIPITEKFKMSHKNILYIVNGTGVWHKGGPASDTGLTGRKIVVDTYGGIGRIGGGAFSGKDPTKVDRSGAYAARYMAKNIVAHGLADKAEVRLAYFIGAKQPVMQEVETFGTNKVSEKVITDYLLTLLDTSVSGILKKLDLLRPIYYKTAAYGHFGKEGLPWEQVVD
ncbi:methionine adenosyltransferase [Candidatus Roizmanbacteria bacterium CG10_big_fil_rev_8_21_14_0_10_45_7]|uniref:Methionine adenosyltransferase n=1 Tax=Candidatus Roizmanbacteria bacterium CG10_big_fil_rev_8_21_14_0_10_45_7 TaxID=1974854 RepID=A0A2M8KVS7_9BACT|nr:MAG: methionine adenosyltransferase [Candidatus Roizmanbacteria bacterium CG10_big_fil_rev_8_21_14_0_10_45_7]